MNERYETFTVLIARISRIIRRIKNQEMAAYGLRSAHISCLYYLSLAESLTATELCERCEEDKATISRALDHLEQNGFVTCEARSAKRYKSPLRLTEKGCMVGQKIVSKVDSALNTVSSVLTEEERLAFYCSLMKICDSLEAISRKPL